MDNLKVKMFLNVKWSILKDKKQEFEALIQKKLAIRVLCSSWLKQILTHYCLKFVAETFQQKKEWYRKLWKQKHRRNKIVRFIRKRLECRSKDKKKRLQLNVKYASVYRVAGCFETSGLRAEEVFLRFMEASSLIEELRSKLI